MSNCSNCYNGCTEVVSDRCVKYTGIDVPVLGIQTGDSLSFVEQALITFLTSTLDGTGITIDLSNIDVCELVNKYLPTCGNLSLVDVLKALVKAACDLQEQVDVLDAAIATLNADYTLPTDCLTGVTASSDTHDIVQAVINKLCALSSQFSQLLIDLPNTYVQIDQLDILIQDYLDTSTDFSLNRTGWSCKIMNLSSNNCTIRSEDTYFYASSSSPTSSKQFVLNRYKSVEITLIYVNSSYYWFVHQLA